MSLADEDASFCTHGGFAGFIADAAAQIDDACRRPGQSQNLLILSDGGDNHSRYTEHDVKAAIKEADVMIYAVGTYERYASTQEELLGPDLLRSISGLTGGQAFTLTDLKELPAVARAIGTELRHQYVLAYQPQSASHDGKWHKISVKLRLPKKLHSLLHVDARAGYYAGGE